MSKLLAFVGSSLEVVELRQWEILGYKVDIDEYISSVYNITASMSSSLVMSVSIFASSPILILPSMELLMEVL